MAPPRRTVGRPGRTLAVLSLVIAGLAGLMFLQGATTPKLALDLAGGTTVTLTALTESGKNPPGSQMNQAVNIIRDRVNGLGVSEAEVAKQGDNHIVVQVPGTGEQRRVLDLIGTTAQLQFRQVYAVGSGKPQTAPKPTPTTSPSKSPDKGKKSPSPSPSSSARGRALSQALTAPTPNPSPSGKPSSAPSSQPTLTPEQLQQLQQQQQQQQQQGDLSGIEDKAVIAQYEKLDCSGKDKKVPGADDPKKKWIAACDEDGQSKYILGPVRVEGKQVGSADAIPPNPTQGQTSWSVSLNFKSLGRKQFGDLTTDASKAQQGSPQRQIAIILDGQVVSAPAINEGAITGGTAKIDGPPQSFNQRYASDLANVLKYGALPLKFDKSSIETVSPTLGNDQLKAGLLAGAVGLALVAAYSLLYYRALGLVSIFSLVVAGVLTYEAVCILGANIDFRLSLAGIAGLIVAIGITADSFIVYFERLRDEVREGKSLRSAVERGWERARRTILVADFVQFLAAAVLYLVSIGGVKGFAFTLGLTTLIDVVVVFLFTKPLISVLAGTRFFGRGHRLSGLDPRRLGARPVKSTPRGARPATKEAGA